MVVEIFAHADDVIAFRGEILADEFRAVAAGTVCIDLDKSKCFLGQAVYIEGGGGEGGLGGLTL